MKYKDRSPFGKRSYELLESVILTIGTTTAGSRFETQLAYAELNPIPEKLWLRSPALWAGVFVTFLASIGLGALSIFQVHTEDKGYWTGCAYTMVFIGIFVACLSYKKIELVRFKSRSGVGALDIIKSGPDKSQFDAFVTELKARIKRAEKVT